MQAKSFLLINGIIVFLLILRLFYNGRLKPSRDAPPSAGHDFENGQKTPAVKSLNCIFMFQAHSFDAFEALGLPAGSSKEACRAAYTELRRTHPESHEFYDLAWRALENHFLG